MNVVVTGSSGFLGLAVCLELTARGFAVARPERSDIQCREGLLRTLTQLSPRAIVNCAVVADFSPNVMVSIHRINTELPKWISEWCAENQCHMIQPSAAIVHGLRFSRANVAQPIVLDSDYARSKFEADQTILEQGCRSTIIRFSGIYGYPGPTHLGLNRAIAGAKSGVVPKVTGRGIGRRNYISVECAASLIVDVAEREQLGLFYSGGKDVLTISEIMQRVCDAFLPGQAPIYQDGEETHDQIVDPSDGFASKASMTEFLLKHSCCACRSSRAS